MWNFRVPGVDIDRGAEDAWIFLPWSEAYRFAVRFLEQMEVSSSDINAILDRPSDESEIRARELSATTRKRLFDVPRIRLALLVLCPDQQEIQRTALHSMNSVFGASLLKMMTAGDTAHVRQLLEGRLN